MVEVSSSGGFEYQFVISPPDIVVCKICHLPSRDPHLTMCCGHVFCKSCLDSMKKAKSIVSNICPVCRSEDFVTFPNKQIDREVKSLHVYCTNKGRGCEWQGEVNYIDNHLTKDGGCEYEDVLCTSGCGEVIQRRDLTKHVENECPRHKVVCQYCQLRGEHQFIDGKHNEECVEYPLACPNRCEDTGYIPRKDMNEHRSRCPLEVINCEYQTMGCEVMMTRQTQKKHNKEKMEYHLHLTKCKLDETSCELTETKAKMKEKNNEANSKIERANTKLNEANFKLSEIMEDLSKTKQELSHVKSQFADRISALEILLPKTYRSESIPVTPVAFSHDHSWSTQLYSDTQVSSPGNQVAPVIFKMTGFAKKMRIKRDWFSDSFFTHDKGYRMRLQVDVAGCDEYEDTHCSVYLRLMRGRYDDYLNWPFKCSFKVKLLNHISDDEHHSDTIDFREVMYDRDVTSRVFGEDMAESSWGCPDFISHGHLLKATPTCQYLKDDCIFIQVHRM